MERRILTAAAATACVLAGIGTAQVAVDAKVVTLRWSVGIYNSDRQRMCNELVATFNKIDAGIQVNVETKSFDNLIVQSAAGAPPDVVWGWGQQYWPLVQSNLLLDLTPNFAKDLGLKTFIPETVEAAKYKGKLYSVDGRPTTMFLFYNQKLFDEAGLADPNKLEAADQWTRDEFLESSRKLTKDTNGDGKPDVYGHSLRVGEEYAASWVYSDGGRYYNADRTKYEVNNTATIRTYKFFYDLYTKYRAADAPGRGTDFPGFTKGKVGTIQAGAWDFGMYRTAAKFDWDIVGIPKASAGRVNAFLPGGAYWIMRGSKHPKESWTFVKWLYGPVAERIVIKHGEIPMTIAGLTSAEYNNPQSGLPKHMSLVYELMKGSKPYNYPPYSTRWAPTVNPLWARIWSGSLGLEEGLDRIAKEATRIIASIKR